jgi:Cu(I)/Ag(I) efflux system membrane fusion protein
MFAQLRIDAGTPQPALFVPSEAVIRSGARSIVIAVREGGRFQPVEVQPGQEIGGKTTILNGLSAGQQVVASGQFLIDSEASLRGAVARLGGTAADEKAGATASASLKNDPGITLHHGVGKVEALSAKDITLSHEPIPSAGWPAMTMTFTLADAGLAKGIKVGDRVNFAFEKGENSSVIRELTPTGAQP